MFILLSIYAAFVMLVSKGITFPLSDALQPALVAAALWCVGEARPYFKPRLRGLAFMVLFTAVTCVLMDACAAGHTRIYDSYLIAADAYLGFDVANLAPGGTFMRIVYSSLIPQVALAIWFLSDKQQIFLRRFAVVLLASIVCLTLYPCRGNYTGNHGIEFIAKHFDQLSTAKIVTWRTAEGIITMPSVHAATAILLMAGFWNSLLRWPIIVLNCLMIYSCVPVGRHYVIDLIAGIALAFLTIIFLKAEKKNVLERKLHYGGGSRPYGLVAKCSR